MNNMDKNTRNTLFRTGAIAASIFALSACGGGGGSSSDSGGTSTAPTSNVSDQIRPGVFETFNVSEELLGFSLLSPTGELRLPLNGKQDDAIIGDLQFRTDDTFSGGGNRRFFSGETDTGTWNEFGVAINGQVQGESMSVISSAPDQDNFKQTRVLRRDGRGDVDGISLNRISGTYTLQFFEQGTQSWFNIDPAGDVTGDGGSSGCVFSAGPDPISPDPNFNVFEVSFLAETCNSKTDNGVYTGLAAYEEINNVRSLKIIADNGTANALFVGTDQ